jgi:hypothetical protein
MLDIDQSDTKQAARYLLGSTNLVGMVGIHRFEEMFQVNKKF